MIDLQRHTTYLGLGSNLGRKEENISRAVALIAEQIGTVERQSALYFSEPWGFESENAFVNAVVCVTTVLSPRQLLRATQRIERQLGKNQDHATQRRHPASDLQSPAPSLSPSELQPSPVYHDRPIDIDILLYDDLTVNEPGLTIPHPLMQQRPFVMEPLKEIKED